MAGNRTETILSVVANAIIDLEKGMTRSCDNIDECLMLRVNDLNNRMRQTDKRATSISMSNIRTTSPLLETADAGLTAKKQYAELVALNIKTHYEYACTSLGILLDGLKSVVIDNDGSTEPPILLHRPHPLGRVKPPPISEFVEALHTALGDTQPEAEMISIALKALHAEMNAFKRENSINNAYNVEHAASSTPVEVVVLQGDTVTRALLQEDWTDQGDQNVLGMVARRPVKEGVAWRPTYDPADEDQHKFQFETLWGNNNISIQTLTSLLTRAIIPGITLSNFLLCMSSHLRCTILSVKEILFDGTGTKRSIYFNSDDPLAFWYTWLVLYDKLEWFMLVSRFYIFMYAGKDNFLDNTIDKCITSTLARAAESLPPWLMLEEWCDSLMYWPQEIKNYTEGEEVILEKSITVKNLLSTAILVNSNTIHPFFKNSVEDQAVFHRLNIESAFFCFSILLGRALDEEDEGVKMLVSSTESKKKTLPCSSIDVPYALGIIPISSHSTMLSKQDTKCDNVGLCPFLSNQTYHLRKIWNMECCSPGNAQSKLENMAIVTNVLSAMTPVLFTRPSLGKQDSEKEWLSLKILTCCEAPSIIKQVWLQGMDGATVERDELTKARIAKTEKTSIGTASGICERWRTRKIKREEAWDNIHGYNKDVINNINNDNTISALNAEHAMWTTAVWKNATSLILSKLTTCPDDTL
nr:wsv220-like protein [Chionoecetes opilio bacilliform virus]